MVDFQKIDCNFGAPARATVIRQDIAVRDVSNLIRGFDSGRPWESKVMIVLSI